MAQVNFRISDEIKLEADELFDRLGLSLSTAITIFLKQAIAHRGFPFMIAEPSRAGRGRVQEAQVLLKQMQDLGISLPAGVEESESLRRRLEEKYA